MLAVTHCTYNSTPRPAKHLNGRQGESLRSSAHHRPAHKPWRHSRKEAVYAHRPAMATWRGRRLSRAVASVLRAVVRVGGGGGGGEGGVEAGEERGGLRVESPSKLVAPVRTASGPQLSQCPNMKGQ